MPGRIAAAMMKPRKTREMTSLSFQSASARTTTAPATRVTTRAGRAALARGRDRGRADARRAHLGIRHPDRGEPRDRLRPGSTGGVAPRRRDATRGDRAARARARRPDASPAAGDTPRAAPPYRLT